MERRAFKEFVREIESVDGWTVSLTASGHYRVQGPGGAKCFIGGTEYRALENSRAQLRRCGWPDPRRIGVRLVRESPPEVALALEVTQAKPTEIKPSEEAPVIVAIEDANASSNETESFGSALTRLREDACLTRIALADLLELTPTMIDNYEQNLAKPSRGRFDKLVELFPDLATTLRREDLRDLKTKKTIVSRTPLKKVAKIEKIEKIAPSQSIVPTTPPAIKLPGVRVVVEAVTLKSAHAKAWPQVVKLVERAAASEMSARDLLAMLEAVASE